MEKDIFSAGLNLSFAIDGRNERVWATLMGWKKNTFFMTELPYIDGAPLKLFSGDKCLVRFIKDGDAHGFETEVLSIQYHPIPLIFFKYPVIVEELAIRKHKRFSTNIPAKIVFTDTLRIDVTITNISECGCLMKTSIPTDVEHAIRKEFAALKRNCQLTFNVLGIALENIECVIKNMRNIRKAEKYLLFGAKFSDITPENNEHINSLISMFATT